MSYEEIIPEWKPERLHKEYANCIQCGDAYSEKVGGIVWDGEGRQYFICGGCSHYVVPGLARDYERLIYDQIDTAPVEIDKGNKSICTRRLEYFKSLVNTLLAFKLLK